MSKVEQYEDLGIVINEFNDNNVTAQFLADAANRALGSVINKYKSINGLGYYTYTRLFQSGVCLILDYCSAVWGYKTIPTDRCYSKQSNQNIFRGSQIYVN